MRCCNVDLFDLIADDHHEPGDFPADHRDGRVAHSLRGPGPEGVLVTRSDEFLGHEPEVAVAPTEMPDIRDLRRVIRCCLSQRHHWPYSH